MRSVTCPEPACFATAARRGLLPLERLSWAVPWTVACLTPLTKRVPSQVCSASSPAWKVRPPWRVGGATSATHGEFRPDNPLFSGLALADGWLTTLDIFNLRLQASLVTLSACQSGQSQVGGGDELLGLMRAFLYAGAASLVLSLWAVEDRSTALLMEAFYAKLAEGWSKGAALRHAQRQFIQDGVSQGDAAQRLYKHPFFWAPFFLVGDTGLL
jgi:hypothetical protein